MESLDELDLELSKRVQILVKSINFYKSCMELNHPQDLELKSFADNNSFIRMTRYSLWCMSVLELNKLYGGSNDYYTIEKLLNILLYNCKKELLNDKIDKSTLKEWMSIIKSEKYNRIIKNLNSLRNKFYAHTDNNLDLSINEFEILDNEIIDIFTFTKEVISEIRLKVLGIDTNFETIKRDKYSALNVLKTLYENK
ncbi:hypothetical protein MY04_4408 [Flammeovirga sp. MY04]|uniref:AbiU2 domain-containing protein n=1 Tax=Flammeovirga sp. MY04 TaxID=1191459 RepID=UPI00080611F4|nr:hypothetical protein [Flammeovirga sp. MY04]ANQ51677.1 hypothetical protein MY04_4337 [Flammeovirga sp. MY04]ANQ51746.1 hypothetical protein MY04_4408 [Flammeovirga sp. MY04]